MDDRNEIWERKDRRMVWMNINNACSQLLAARIQAGFYKPKDGKETMNELRDMITIEYADFLTLDIGDGTHGGEEKPLETIAPQIIEKGKDATEKMKKTIWGIVYGKDGTPALEDELKEKGLDRFTVTKKHIDYDWASDFIDKHKKTDWIPQTS